MLSVEIGTGHTNAWIIYKINSEAIKAAFFSTTVAVSRRFEHVRRVDHGHKKKLNTYLTINSMQTSRLFSRVYHLNEQLV